MNKAIYFAVLLIGCLATGILFLPVNLTAAEGNSTVQVQLLSPQPNSNVEIDDIMIVFSILQNMEKVELEGITLLLDDIDVSSSVQLTEGIISFLPLDIKIGAHTAKLSIVDKTGKSISPISLTFNIIPSVVKYKTTRSTPIIRFTGSNTMAYQANDTSGPGQSLRQDPSTSNSLSIGAVGQYQGINIEATAMISSESSFDMQPSDSYSLKAYTDWGGIIAGDSYPSYSNSLAISSNRVRGASMYAEVATDFAKLRLDGVIGQSKKYIPAAYTPQQNFQAVNASINMSDKAQLDVVYLTGEDVQDGDFLTGAKYYENDVLGASFSYTPSYDFNLSIMYAQSDTTDVRTGEKVETQTPDKAFIGNNAALSAYLQANIGTIFTFNASYELYGLDFLTYGNPYGSTDSQTISVGNSLYLFDRALMLTARYNNQRDNLAGNLATTTTTATYYGTAQLSFGTGFPTISGTYNLMDAESDDVTVAGYPTDQQSTTWSIGMSQSLTISDYYLTARADYRDSKRKNEINPAGSVNTQDITGSLSLTMPNYASLSASYSDNDLTYPYTDSTTTTETISLTGSYPVLSILTLSGSYGITSMTDNLSKIDQDKDSWDLGITWTINDFQRMTASYNEITYKDNIDPDTKNYTSSLFRLTYMITFDGFSY